MKNKIIRTKLVCLIKWGKKCQRSNQEIHAQEGKKTKKKKKRSEKATSKSMSEKEWVD